MNTINNVRRSLKPLMPLCASVVLATSACSTPKNQEIKETNVEVVAPSEEMSFLDYMQTEAGITRFLLGVGIGVAGIAATKKIREANKLSKEKEQAQYRTDLMSELDSFYLDRGYLGAGEQIKNIKKLLEKPLGYDNDMKDNVRYLIGKFEIAFKKGDLRTYPDNALAALPDLKYFIDKMTSSPEEWNVNRNKYPDWEKVVNTTDFADHVNRCSNYTLGIYHSVEQNLGKTLAHTLRELKKEIFDYGVFDNKAFAELVVYIDGSLAKLSFGCNATDLMSEIRDGIIPRMGLVLGAPSSTVDSSNKPFSEEDYEFEDEELNPEEQIQQENVFTSAINKARKFSSNDSNENDVNNKITFKDVGGQDEVIKQLSKKVLYPLMFPNAFDKFKNFKPSRGIVLHGPTGTGKTLLALALANEANVPFFKVDCNELIESYVGSSEKNLRNLFKKAKAQQPCILFFDEFDSIARKRTGDTQGRHDDKVVNQLLTLLCDVEKNNPGIYIIAATNRLDIIDPAILRGKRLATHIEVGPPNTRDAVQQILDLHLKDIPLAKNFSKQKFVDELLKRKSTGADIAEIVAEAFENAYERSGLYEKMEARSFREKDLKRLYVTDVDFEKAINTIKNASTKSRPPIGFNK